MRLNRPLLPIWATLAGAMPLVLMWWEYKLAIMIWSQAGPARTLGTFAVLALGLVATAGLIALVVRRLPWPPARALSVALFGVVVLDTVLTGLSIFYLTPRFAPRPVLAAAAVVAAVLVVRFVRYDDAMRRIVTRVLVGVGLAALVLVEATTPWVLVAYAHDLPHLPLSPRPPVGAAVRADAPRRIVLVTFDALRLSSTTLADPHLDTTPNLARLAETSTTFTQARAASDNTLVSLPTVLTGIRPNEYFPYVRNDSEYLREGFLTGLAGFLAPAGYHGHYATMLVNPLTFGLNGEFASGTMTAGMFRANQFNARSFLPLAATWDWTCQKLSGHWDDNAGNRQNEVPAAREAFADGLAYLKAAQGPTFLWVHVGVPHTPYYDVPKAEAAHPGDPARYRRITEAMVAAADVPTLAHYKQIYEDYVRFGDAQLGQFLDGLVANHLYDDTLLVVTSDHGEEFGLPGHIPHGNGIATEAVTHVPLVIHAPHQRQRRQIDVLVGHRDLVPTVLALVYQHPPAGLVGTPLLSGPLDPHRYVHTWAMSSKYIPQLRQAQTIACYHDHYKLLVRYPTHEESLYDLSKDPDADVNLAERLPGVVDQMRDELRRELHP